MKRPVVLTAYPAPQKLSFPADEKKNVWLTMLLEAYYIADKGIYDSIKLRLRQGHSLACMRGCSNCCVTHTAIPVYPLEIIGLYWYVIEKIELDVRKALRDQIRTYVKGNPCPFLLEGVCSVHQMRPLACRHFNVFHKPCAPDEDPYYTRRNDVLSPNEKMKDKALSAMLPFHGITLRAERKEAMRTGYLHRQAQSLQELEWHKLAQRIRI